MRATPPPPFIHARHRPTTWIRRVGITIAALTLFIAVAVGGYLAINTITTRVAEAIVG